MPVIRPIVMAITRLIRPTLMAIIVELYNYQSLTHLVEFQLPILGSR